MKTPIWVYIAVVILSAGAGLAIAGIPDTSPREPTIIPPPTTEAPDPLEQAAALVEEAASLAHVSDAVAARQGQDGDAGKKKGGQFACHVLTPSRSRRSR